MQSMKRSIKQSDIESHFTSHTIDVLKVVVIAVEHHLPTVKKYLKGWSMVFTTKVFFVNLPPLKVTKMDLYIWSTLSNPDLHSAHTSLNKSI